MITDNDDGTVTFAGRTLSGYEVADLAVTLLAAMSEATEKAGLMDEAKTTKPLGLIPSIRPNMVQVRTIDETPTPLLVLICGNARLGVALPEHVLRDLSRGLLTDLPPDRRAH